MKKTMYMLLVIALGFAAVSATDKTNTVEEVVVDKNGINFFHGTWDEAVAKAKKENKLIFVDAYAVWCGPCKRMSAYTFTNASVGEYFNEHFVSLKVDCEKGEGIKLSKQWGIEYYPTLLVFNPKGELKGKEVGAMDASAFLNLGKQWVAKLNK